MTLTLEFYKRNYIEGLFLSSGIIKSPDHTMEQLMRVAKTLRQEHGFAGYIHLKTDPGGHPLADRAGGAVRRPHVDQSGAADSGKPEAPGAGKERRHHPHRDGPDARAHRRGQGGTPPLLAGRAEHADDRRRRRHHRRDGAETTRHALRQLRAAAGLLFRLQPDPGGQRGAAAQAAAAAAREPAVPGRLAAALLRLHRATRSRPAARTACWTWRSIPSWPGR